MKDLEDIFKAIIAYLREELPIQGGGTISRLNYFINEKNIEKGDTLLDAVDNDESRFVLHQRTKDIKLFKSWIDLSVGVKPELNSNFDTVAKDFVVSVSSVMYDNLSRDTFYKSVRMADVLTTIIGNFFKDNKEYGFMYGELETNNLPDRVSIEGNRHLMSGVVYISTIQ